jgi:excisionase family DNA binding protein
MYKGEPAKVERLTLQQAAGRLGISNEVVRQQVEEGILPHGKGPDGGGVRLHRRRYRHGKQ